MRIQKESLVFTNRKTSIYNLFSNQATKEYKKLIEFLQTCEEGFIQTLSSIEGCSVGDSPTILYSIIDIYNLTEFLADGDGDKQTRDLLKPLLVVATAHQIDEITF